MRVLKFQTSEEAYNGINGYMIYDKAGIMENGVYSKSQTIMYDTHITILKSLIPDDWDFTKTVNYRKSKWTTLVGNYIDMPHLQEVVSEVVRREAKKATAYTVSFQFDNSHGIGKGCLLSCTFTRRPGSPVPILVVTTRATEVYKRLMMDLLLLHRIGQEAYGEDGDFAIQLWLPHAWQGVSWAAMWYSLQTDEDLLQLEVKYNHENQFVQAVEDKVSFFEGADFETFNYNADKRAAKVIQRKVATPPLLASDCTF